MSTGTWARSAPSRTLALGSEVHPYAHEMLAQTGALLWFVLVCSSPSHVVGSSNHIISNKHREFTWFEAPIVVGGTSGSGTRGVVKALSKMGVYMVRVSLMGVFYLAS